MEKAKVIFKNAWPYQQDKMNLPVGNLETAIPFYEKILGFTITAREDKPHKRATLLRDGLEIGLAENGGDPTQDGCFLEVDNVESAFEEFKLNGLQKDSPDFQNNSHGDTRWKVFFVVAPDGLCYCFGERQN